MSRVSGKPPFSRVRGPLREQKRPRCERLGVTFSSFHDKLGEKPRIDAGYVLKIRRLLLGSADDAFERLLLNELEAFDLRPQPKVEPNGQ